MKTIEIMQEGDPRIPREPIGRWWRPTPKTPLGGVYPRSRTARGTRGIRTRCAGARRRHLRHQCADERWSRRLTPRIFGAPQWRRNTKGVPQGGHRMKCARERPKASWAFADTIREKRSLIVQLIHPHQPLDAQARGRRTYKPALMFVVGPPRLQKDGAERFGSRAVVRPLEHGHEYRLPVAAFAPADNLPVHKSSAVWLDEAFRRGSGVGDRQQTPDVALEKREPRLFVGLTKESLM